jgi:type IV pilus assembly protein PilA
MRTAGDAGNIGGMRSSRAIGREDGFSLIELLVVVLIIGVLAAIAIPSFVGQKDKATDAQAKELARTAQTAAEAIGTDHNGHYDNVTVKELKQDEPSIPVAVSATEAYLSSTTHATDEYSVTVTAADGSEFTISRAGNGAITRQCTSTAGKQGCAGNETSTW